MNEFQKEKKTFLNKKDKSSAGKIDDDIVSLINLINSYDCFYTTSSCSGRIVILKEQGKKESNWSFKSHEPITKIEGVGWFMQEPVIIHVRCKKLECCNWLLKLATENGFGKSGIISLDKLTLEIKGTNKIETFLTSNLSQEYLDVLKDKANEKLIKEKNNIKKLEEKLRTITCY